MKIRTVKAICYIAVGIGFFTCAISICAMEFNDFAICLLAAAAGGLVMSCGAWMLEVIRRIEDARRHKRSLHYSGDL